MIYFKENFEIKLEIFLKKFYAKIDFWEMGKWKGRDGRNSPLISLGQGSEGPQQPSSPTNNLGKGRERDNLDGWAEGRDSEGLRDGAK